MRGRVCAQSYSHTYTLVYGRPCGLAVVRSGFRDTILNKRLRSCDLKAQ